MIVSYHPVGATVFSGSQTLDGLIQTLPGITWRLAGLRSFEAPVVADQAHQMWWMGTGRRTPLLVSAKTLIGRSPQLRATSPISNREHNSTPTHLQSLIA
jgi:hypothetical protein